jgi:prolyl oligopeptidase
LKWIKFGGPAWAGKGFFYSRYDAPQVGHELSSKNEFQKVYYHRLGTEQAEDELVYGDKANPERFHTVNTTEDERFAILNITDRGNGKRGNALYFRDLSKSEKNFTPIVAEIGNDTFQVMDNIGTKFLVLTNQNAPNGRVALYNSASAGSRWKEILPEKTDALQRATSAGG